MKLLFVFITLYNTTLGRLGTSNLTIYVRRGKLENNWPVLGQQDEEHDSTQGTCVKRGPSASISESESDPTEDIREYDDRTARFRKNRLS
jgi:hypothetical protein